MTRKQKLNKILVICNKRADKCEEFLTDYEEGPENPTTEETNEMLREEELLEILVQIIDIIE